MIVDPPDDPCHALILRASLQPAVDPPGIRLEIVH
jgi:hypothetical protein